MKDKSIKERTICEIKIFLTYWLLKILDCLSWSVTATILRANILRFLGLKLGKGVKISTGFVLHGMTSALVIGEETFINKNGIFDMTAPITIGKYCEFGFNVLFTTSNHELRSNYRTRRPLANCKPITVGDYVWVGSNVILLGGITIGSGAVIAAGSVVTKDVPPNTLVAGVPAKVLKDLNNVEKPTIEDERNCNDKVFTCCADYR